MAAACDGPSLLHALHCMIWRYDTLRRTSVQLTEALQTADARIAQMQTIHMDHARYYDLRRREQLAALRQEMRDLDSEAAVLAEHLFRVATPLEDFVNVMDALPAAGPRVQEVLREHFPPDVALVRIDDVVTGRRFVVAVPLDTHGNIRGSELAAAVAIYVGTRPWSVLDVTAGRPMLTIPVLVRPDRGQALSIAY